MVCLFLFGPTGCSSIVDFFANQLFLPNQGVREASHQVGTTRRVGFTTRGGIQLLADFHRPMGLEQAPTILVRIPFTKTFSNQLQSDVVGRYWASRGYNVIIQGTRGRYESGGKFYPLRHEREDGIETLRWLGQQPWHDGRLAMWGGSAFGHTQWAVADQTSPGPAAFFVQIVSTSFRKMFFPGGAFSLESAVYWAIRSRGPEDRTVNNQDLEKGVNEFPIIESDDRAIGDTKFFNDWVQNEHNDNYWRIIDGERRTETLQAPALLLAGWFDPFLPSQIEDFIDITTNAKKEVASETRLIIGPWGHATSVMAPGMKKAILYRSESIAPSIPWFDYHLRVSQDPLNMPHVKIFVMGKNHWRNENEWPLARTKYTSYYLHSKGSANSLNGDGWLDNSPPVTSEPPDSYIYNPLHPVPSAGGAMLGDRSGIFKQNTLETRSDVLVFSTPHLSKPLEVTGPVRAVLYVSTDAPSTDFTAKLVDVHPDGSAFNICDGILRRNYEKSEKETINPVRIEIELWPTSNVFLAGHQVRLEISSSNFPRYDRNPNTGEFIPTATKLVPAAQTLFHSSQYPSEIILPIIP